MTETEDLNAACERAKSVAKRVLDYYGYEMQCAKAHEESHEMMAAGYRLSLARQMEKRFGVDSGEVNAKRRSCLDEVADFYLASCAMDDPGPPGGDLTEFTPEELAEAINRKALAMEERMDRIEGCSA